MQFGWFFAPNRTAQKVSPAMYNLPEIAESVEQLEELVCIGAGCGSPERW